MPLDASRRRIVERLFDAMEAGPSGEDEMVALFSEEAVLIESFSGSRRAHRGKEAIRELFRDLWREPPPPNMRLVLERIDIDGDTIRADWSCHSTAFSRPRQGFDRFQVHDGKIVRLEIVLTQERG